MSRADRGPCPSAVVLERKCRYDSDLTPGKRRLTVTVDPELVAAGQRAVAAGAADPSSSWVNVAPADRARRDAQLARLHAAIADHEAEFGEITAEEIARQRRADREDAAVVRGRRTPRSAPKSERKSESTSEAGSA